MKQDEFGTKTTECYLSEMLKRHRQELAELLLKLANSDRHERFSNADTAMIFTAGEFAGLDVAALLLKTASVGMRDVRSAQEYLQAVLFSEKTPGAGISGQPATDLLQNMAAELAFFDQSPMFSELVNMGRAWRRIKHS